MKRAILALSGLALLGGCGIFEGGGKPKTPTVGERVAVLAREGEVEVDPELAAVAITLPAARANSDWTQSGGNAAKSVGHLALGASPAQVWRVSIGQGSTPRALLAASPIFADGKLFTIDAQANVRAISPVNGATLWQTQVRGQDVSDRVLFGGGLAFDGGRIYAANGAGYTAALDAGTGAILWSVKPGGPLRGAPTVANDNVYVTSQDNQLFALNPADGSVRWTETGTVEVAGVFGNASPAAAQGTVIAGFSSGELIAYRYENGRVLWGDALSRTSISTAVASLSDVDADPVIDNGRVYSIGQGGRMVAIELTTGQRIWEVNLAGISTPAVVGEWLFVVTDQAQLIALARATGKVKWITQLTRYRNPEKRSGSVNWVGPILAGDRLILANSEGQIVYASPYDGAVQATVETDAPVSLPPIVVDNVLYVLHDDGNLAAWR